MLIELDEFLNKIMGAKFAPNGRDYQSIDCFGIIYLCYRDVLGIELKEYRDIFTENNPQMLLRVAEVMKDARSEWETASQIREFDMINIRTGRHAFHVGLALNDKQMLHADDICGVVVEDLSNPLWKNRIDWIYRHKYMKGYLRYA